MPVSRRSGTCRTAARGPGTRWTSGTDRVCDTRALCGDGAYIGVLRILRALGHCNGGGQMDCQWLTLRVFAVMDRDRRLTGYLRGQTDQALAPAGFEFTNGWRVSLSRDMISHMGMIRPRGGFANHRYIRSRSVSCKNKTTAHTPRRRDTVAHLCSGLFFL